MKEISTEIIIASGGTAGLAAAVAAAQLGAKVIVFEKLANTGGTTLVGGSGPFGVESRLQKLRQITMTKDEAFKIYMDFNHWRVNARLVRALIEKSGDTIDWLEKLGVEFFDVASHNPGFHQTFHLVKTEPGRPQHMGGSVTMTKKLARRAGEMGVTFFLKTPVKQLIKENDIVTEVIGEDYHVLPGLYAAGMEIAAELYNGTYAFVLPANAMGFALNSGRIAAENAVKFIHSKNR